MLAIFAATLVALFAEDAIKRRVQFLGLIGSLLSGGATSPAQAAASAEKAAGAIGTIGLSTGGGLGLIFAVKKVWDLFRPLTSVPADLLATFSTHSATGPRAAIVVPIPVRGRFSTFCDTLRQPPHPGLVIFVNNLDRCAPSQTVNVLEAINFVTSAGRCFVILGLDEDRVKAAIADVYKDMTLRLDDVEAPHAAATDAARPSNESASSCALPRATSRSWCTWSCRCRAAGRKQSRCCWVSSRRRAARRKNGASRSPPCAYQLRRDGRGRILPRVRRRARDRSRYLPAAGIANRERTVEGPAGGRGPDEGCAPGRKDNAAEQPAPRTDFVSDAALQQLGILSGRAPEAIPSSALVLAFVMLLAVLALQFLKRLNPEPVVADSPEFIDALKIWVDGVSARRETPACGKAVRQPLAVHGDAHARDRRPAPGVGRRHAAR